MFRRLLLASLIPLAGCYQDPNDLRTDEVLTLVADAPDPVADGASVIQVQVGLASNAEPGQPVTLRSSDGRWLSGTPTPDGAITMPVPAGLTDGYKLLTATLQLSRVPGDVRLEAEIEGFVARAVVRSQPALPDALYGQTDVASLTADGRSTAHLRFDFERATGAASQGTRLALVVCCTSGDQPVACGFRPPVRVPAAAWLGESESLTLSAIAEQLSASELPDGQRTVEVIAQVTQAGETISCATPSGALSVRIPLTLNLP
jgi:hypothetical protein